MSDELFKVPEDLGVCAWCGEKATGMLTVEPPLVRKKGGVSTVIDAGRKVPACETHMRLEARDLEREKKRAKITSLRWKEKQGTMLPRRKRSTGPSRAR